MTRAYLEPLNSLLALDLVGSTNLGLSATALGNTLSWAGHASIEIHSVNSDRWVVLDTEIDVLRDTEPEVASLGEVALAKLVLLDLETTLENLLCLWAADGDVNRDLFVTTNTEGSDGVAGLAYREDCVSYAISRVDGKGKKTYCRLGFDQTIAPTPLRLW